MRTVTLWLAKLLLLFVLSKKLSIVQFYQYKLIMIVNNKKAELKNYILLLLFIYYLHRKKSYIRAGQN